MGITLFKRLSLRMDLLFVLAIIVAILAIGLSAFIAYATLLRMLKERRPR